MPRSKTTTSIKVVAARLEDDDEVCRIAKLSRYTKDFASHRFYRTDIEQTYANKEVGVAKRGREIVGFVYCKHLKMRPMSVIHFMGVAPGVQGLGVGRALLEWGLAQSPHRYVELSCEHSNTVGMAFYTACGWKPLRTGAYGTLPRVRPYTRFARSV